MNKIGMIIEGLHQPVDEGKVNPKDFTVKGTKFKLKKDVYYGAADAIMDVKKAKKLGFKIEAEEPDGYYEFSIPKGTILTATGNSGREGDEFTVNGVNLYFSDPEDMDVEKL